MAKEKLKVVEVPGWLVEQFKIEEREEEGPSKGLLYDRVERFDVGTFKTKEGKRINVELEAASGQSNWWTTINVFDEHGNLLEQSEAGFDLLGEQEYIMSDGTQIIFDVVTKGPRDWSPRGELSGHVLGLHTGEERQHARAMALGMLAAMRSGRIEKAIARGYLMAIRDLAADEGHEELAEKMQEWIGATM